MTSVERPSAIAAPHRRLQQIMATLLPRPCVAEAGQSITQLEGESIARLSAVKTVLLKVGQRGVPLGSPEEMAKLFTAKGLDPIVVEDISEIPADAEVIVTTGTPINADVLAKAPKAKLIAVAFTGVDHIDLSACKAHGAKVVHVPGYSTDATAELAVGLVISHLRRLRYCHQNIKDGVWGLGTPKQEDLRSKTVGIIGLGKIGIRLAELFHAFKVKGLVGYSLNQDPEFSALGGVYVDSLASVFLDSDIICVCVPLTDLSMGMISEKLLELLRPDGVLVNISRGEVVDEVALAKLLAQRRFRAALDVFSNEPLPAESPLRQVPDEQLLMTPHIGYQSEGSLAVRLEVTIKNILAHLAGHAINKVA
mmetsp:Transcript_9357/g.23333  ORF Transcript_9357/g.23333 Transcript_9357/m.23333 type:complete len:366 (+) Transcript_9357:99-1196(+)|eukprot:CAMPEP_0183409704 /NCGR_PEP_ID=MMETSP0370-20130417/19034_1 /TAXON_ID=268820 /ORGANISM="Peridinium aciculiferum, Strain PAER-2" /LENGTH=365 /DNA_ID=CAMNT_0025592435 /DNA_START=97 /DNA_END=1194 /DNA_ORIENTATION=-